MIKENYEDLLSKKQEEINQLKEKLQELEQQDKTCINEIKHAIDRIERYSIIAAKQVLTLEEVAFITGLSRSWIYKATSNHTIPCYKPNNKLLYFDRDEINAWMKQNRVATTDEINNNAEKYIMSNTGANGYKRNKGTKDKKYNLDFSSTKPITEVKLSARALNACIANGIKTQGELFEAVYYDKLDSFNNVNTDVKLELTKLCFKHLTQS